MEDKTELIKKTICELFRISALFEQIERLPIPVDNETQVSTREAHMIKALGENRLMSVTQLGIHFGITKSGASQMVKKLENKGFLLKQQAAHSNKEFELSLTPLGWKVFEAHEQHHGKDFSKLEEGLTPFPISRISTLFVLMETIRTIMEDRIAGPGTRKVKK